MRVALITGASGFTGSRLASALLADGWQVHIVLRANSSTALLDACLSALHVHRHDGSTGQLCEIVASVAPDVVFHLAALFLAQHEAKDILPLVDNNLGFSTQLAEAMARAGVTRLVNAGTSWQHIGNADYEPANLYAATKQAFEAILQYYVVVHAFSVITLKLFDSYGPGDPRAKLLRLLQRCEGADTPLQMSPGEQLIDLVYIDDVVAAFVIAAERLLSLPVPCNASYAVSSGEPISVRQLVTVYEEACGFRLPIAFGGRPYRPREVMVPWNTGPKLPGWHPTVSLVDGIRNMRQAPPEQHP